MGLKIAPRNKNQEFDKQMDDMHKNMEIIVKEVDAIWNRIKELEGNQFEGVVLIQK